MELDKAFAAQGNLVGIAEVDFLEEGFMSYAHSMPMCFMDENLVIAVDSQVRIYSVELKE